uniref:AlNc14C191G8447 protein n=1 Tax=Albugo laibachii Nc14 TaxID=890382 RepID=F0WPV6_9STRA|nr:AlNc14C191G8447 [Albugo laibachii Nc14]|eukprot:CCA23357.1 AlNc14C191G8447 [Albugo laibachii Nc14]
MGQSEASSSCLLSYITAIISEQIRRQLTANSSCYVKILSVAGDNASCMSNNHSDEFLCLHDRIIEPNRTLDLR